MMRTGLVTVIFLALLLVGCVVYPGIGARFIAPQTVLQAFLHFDPQNFDHNVIVRLRLPRLAAALLTGASLGVAGALLQAVIRNPLGEPHILGLNAGAALLSLPPVRLDWPFRLDAHCWHLRGARYCSC